MITGEHIRNNTGVRGLLTRRGIKPGVLPPEEDVKKLRKRVKQDEKLFLEEYKKKLPK
jgi:DNA-damage-inducible protein D